MPAWAAALWSIELDTVSYAADVPEEDNPHISIKVFPSHCCSQLPPGKFLISQED